MKQESPKGLMHGERKKTLRKAFRARRNKLSLAARREKSMVIGRRLRATSAYRNAGTIMFYLTHDSEVMTESMMMAALRSGKRIVVPLVNSKRERDMKAVMIKNCDKDLCIGAFGIREPVSRKCIAPADIDLVIVPGIAFDMQGHRLGYGKGYYDTWLRQFPAERRIGLAFDLQLAHRLPAGENDLPMGRIVTEKGIVTTKGLRS